MLNCLVFRALGAAVLIVAAAGMARADDREEAREAFARGVSAFDAGHFEEALAAFQDAHRIKPHPNVRLNIASCYMELGRPVEAIFHFEQFLEESEHISRAQRREVQGTIRKLENQTALLKLRIAPDGARVTLDQEETRRTPIMAPVRLTAGSHEVVVTHPGFEDAREEVNLQAGEKRVVRIALRRARLAPEPEPEPEPIAAAAPPRGEPEPVSEPESSVETADESVEDGEGLGVEDDAALASVGTHGESEPLEAAGQGWRFRLTPAVAATGGVTAAAGVLTLVTGIMALRAEDDFDRAVDRSNDPTRSPAERQRARESGLDASDRADRLALTSDIFLAATVAGVAATVFVVVLDGKGAGEEREEARWTASPAVARDGGGLVLRGAF